ncbi:MAG: hypothetical protein HUJ58_10295 [Erysipelotrichaceae bacterium]|nr:hypothetical protein [Erysipelotrichaceae bacterium]
MKDDSKEEHVMQTGDLIPFGSYEWRVLDIRDEKALLITDKYHRTASVS